MAISEAGSTDVSLLHRIQRDEAAAWTAFDSIYRPLLAYWASRGGVAEADVADVVQELMSAVHRGIAKFSKDRAGSSFRGWLFTASKNQIRKYHAGRNSNREVPLLGDVPWSDQLSRLEDEEGSARPESVKILVQRIGDLVRRDFSEPKWAAFHAVVADEQPVRDVARTLGMTEGAVRAAKARILKRIRDEFGDLM